MTPSRAWCHTFVSSDVPIEGQFRVQWQFSAFTFSCIAKSLDFARIILDFVDETRGNVTCRDIPMGGGAYRCMDEKAVDLSPYFVEMRFWFQKLGDADDGYMLKFEHPSGASMIFQLYDNGTEVFLDGLREIAEDAA